jgi:hypothetical protein
MKSKITPEEARRLVAYAIKRGWMRRPEPKTEPVADEPRKDKEGEQ